MGLPYNGKAPDIGAWEFGMNFHQKAWIMKEWEALKIPVAVAEDSVKSD